MGTDIHMFLEVKEGGFWNYHSEYNVLANHSLFAILADVRNGMGFAGCDTGDGFVPISNPRGLPEDACFLVEDKMDNINFHTHSWLTLDEIINYDYAQTTILRGYVNPREYQLFKNGDKFSYCGGTTREIVSNSEMDKLLEKSSFGPYTQIEWTSTYREVVGKEWNDFLDIMELINRQYDEARIVFGFDS